ncbi:MAG: cytochrome c biogenesis protein CcdA [Chloroflexota bacterium]
MTEAGAPSLVLALLAGLVSFVSPCVLPIVPGYLSFVSGVAIDPSHRSRRETERVLIASLLFVAGFATVFVALGATAGFVGEALGPYRSWLTRLAGLVMVVLGLAVMGLVAPGWLYRQRSMLVIDRPYGPVGAALVGMSFALGWTPCIGPVLGSILLYAGANETAQQAAMLLLAYSTGLGLPFVAAALGAARLSHAMSLLGPVGRVAHPASGALLVAIGALLLTNQVWLINTAVAGTQRLLWTVGS